MDDLKTIFGIELNETEEANFDTEEELSDGRGDDE